jgi:hypothetical protein
MGDPVIAFIATTALGIAFLGLLLYLCFTEPDDKHSWGV